MNELLTATHIVRWADTRASQGLLPELVRRLILGTVDRSHIQRIDFPAEDSINRPGVDGLLQVTLGSAYVPSGQSVWEMGVDKNFARKADKDYAKRTSSPGPIIPGQTTFIFFTPRRWQGKHDWVTAKADERIWADVRSYDADDLEQWIATCPAVQAWACRVIRELPTEGIRDMQEVWEQWQYRTNPELKPEMLLAGRNPAVERVRAWLASPPARLQVRAATTDEAVGFLAAVIQTADELERARLRSRSLYVSTPESWRA